LYFSLRYGIAKAVIIKLNSTGGFEPILEPRDPEIEAHLKAGDLNAVIIKPYSPSEMGKQIAAVLHKSASTSMAQTISHNPDL
jgi:hypothetical protein